MRQTRKSRIRSKQKTAMKAAIERFFGGQMVKFAGYAVGQVVTGVVLFFLKMYFFG